MADTSICRSWGNLEALAQEVAVTRLTEQAPAPAPETSKATCAATRPAMSADPTALRC
ncbi:hypothetical protein ACWV95_07565 [Streptomyces albus]